MMTSSKVQTPPSPHVIKHNQSQRPLPPPFCDYVIYVQLLNEKTVEPVRLATQLYVYLLYSIRESHAQVITIITIFM